MYAFINNPKNIWITPNPTDKISNKLVSLLGFISPNGNSNPKAVPNTAPATVVAILKYIKNLANFSCASSKLSNFIANSDPANNTSPYPKSATIMPKNTR